MRFLLLAGPIVEILVAAVVAHFFGWGWTVLALVALSITGMLQLRVQGIAAWVTAQREVAEGHSPAPLVLDGALRVLGAILLIVPGFVSAFVGSLLLLRPTRRVASRTAGGFVVTRLHLPFDVVTADGQATGWRFRSRGAGDVVDVQGWEEPSPRPGTQQTPMIMPPETPET